MEKGGRKMRTGNGEDEGGVIRGGIREREKWKGRRGIMKWREK